jgi:nucleoid DNA-binding protein
VTKKDIVRTISDDVDLTQQKTKEIVQKVFAAIIDTLVTDGRIELRNFGVFEVKRRAARKARNPRTSQQVSVPAKYVVTFKPGKEMEQRVRELCESAENAVVAGPWLTPGSTATPAADRKTTEARPKPDSAGAEGGPTSR